MSETELCNLALGRIGAKRINNLETDQTLEAIQCRLHYPQTRDAVLRSCWWPFALTRVALEQAEEGPINEWDNQFILPSDFLRLKEMFEDGVLKKRMPRISYHLESEKILTDETSVAIIYVRREKDTAKFDPMFTEVLALTLAMRLSMPLARDNVMRRELQEELFIVNKKARTIALQETNTIYTDRLISWDHDGRRQVAGTH